LVPKTRPIEGWTIPKKGGKNGRWKLKREKGAYREKTKVEEPRDVER